MDKDSMFQLYFASVASFQFHPANHILGDTVKEKEAVLAAARIAHLMVVETDRRLPWVGER